MVKHPGRGIPSIDHEKDKHPKSHPSHTANGTRDPRVCLPPAPTAVLFHQNVSPTPLNRFRSGGPMSPSSLTRTPGPALVLRPSPAPSTFVAPHNSPGIPESTSALGNPVILAGVGVRTSMLGSTSSRNGAWWWLSRLTLAECPWPPPW